MNLKQSGFCTTYSFKILVSERKCKINLKSRESQKKKKKKKLQSSYTCLCKARSKTRKPEKSRKSRKFFSQNFKSEFSILAVGQTRKLGNKETWNSFSEISDFCEFLICHFFIFQKKNVFNILKHRNSRSYMFLNIRLLKNCAIFIGRHLCWSLFFKRLTTC